MKTTEIETYLKKAKKEKLCDIVKKLYDKGDEKTKKKIITAFVPKKERTEKVEIPSPKAFLEEMKTFQEHAEDQLYLAPNRIISKKQRSNWRGYVKQLKENCLLFLKAKEYETAYKSLEILLDVLDRGSMKYYLFVSDRAIDTSRTEPRVWCNHLFEAYLQYNKHDYQDFFSHFIPLAKRWNFHNELYENNVFLFLWERCTTWDLQEIFFDECTRQCKKIFQKEFRDTINSYEFIVKKLDNRSFFSGSGLSLLVFLDGKKIYDSKGSCYFGDLRFKKWFKNLKEEEKEVLETLRKKGSESKSDWAFEGKMRNIFFNGMDLYFQNEQPKKAETFLKSIELGIKKESHNLYEAYYLYKKENYSESLEKIKQYNERFNVAEGKNLQKEIEKKI